MGLECGLWDSVGSSLISIVIVSGQRRVMTPIILSSQAVQSYIHKEPSPQASLVRYDSGRSLVVSGNRRMTFVPEVPGGSDSQIAGSRIPHQSHFCLYTGF